MPQALSCFIDAREAPATTNTYIELRRNNGGCKMYLANTVLLFQFVLAQRELHLFWNEILKPVKTGQRQIQEST